MSKMSLEIRVTSLVLFINSVKTFSGFMRLFVYIVIYTGKACRSLSASVLNVHKKQTNKKLSLLFLALQRRFLTWPFLFEATFAHSYSLLYMPECTVLSCFSCFFR